MPLLQIALDLWEEHEALELARRLGPYADILEVGTTLLLACGLSIVQRLRDLLGGRVPLFVDAKIVDAGEEEAEAVFRHGADIVSVLGGAFRPTLEGVRKVARRWGKRWMVDTIDLPLGFLEKAALLQELRPDFVGLHLPHDVAREDERAWQEVGFSSFPWRDFPLLVAGGITPRTLPGILAFFHPEVVVVGSAITRSPHPEEVARTMRRMLDEYSGEGC
ncbi:orotidine 5'-phosphate decarboxylase / HUMPS family protein [Candidatus Caldatribacterium sp. SIUC1]|uniref:orotidine 5'-phosphate decarboxylase / HUMPS family protein n=1 Tax=Candidatus Caldatribacterium sp. SIUC1 TaxID=3418365 RepID=UPI003F6912C7